MAGFGVDRGSGSSSGNAEPSISESLIDAKGDLIVGTAADTAGRLAAGANETRLVADSAEAAGLKYVADTVNYAIAAKGDILAGTAADTVAALTVGSNGRRLATDSAQATGLAWVADTQNTVADAKGDLLVGTAADTIARLAVGVNDTVLTADSAQTTGTKWATAPLPAGYITGLGTSNNVTDPTNDIDIAAGSCRDGSNLASMALAASLTKKLDASWVVGTNQGMLDGTESVAGTPDNDTFYFLWLIRRSDTGVVDVLASESGSAPTLPTGYDQKRLIGAVRRGTAANAAYYQDGDWFRFQANRAVLSAGTSTTAAAVTISGSVPSVATTFACRSVIAQTSGAATDMTLSLVTQVASSVDYTTLARHQIHTDSTEDFVSSGGEFVIPVTGVFNYRLDATGDNGSRSGSIWVTGFKLAR